MSVRGSSLTPGGVVMKAARGRRADVRIYDDIAEWGVSAKAFASEIAALDVDELNVFVNSPGGSAWDGAAIMNALRRHKATVNITVDGLAASAASLICMAGDHIVMNRGAQMMIHEVTGGLYGNAKDFADAASTLNKLADSYAATYAARAGGTAEHWRAAMKAETWYTAEEAVLAGLADDWTDAPAVAASFDLSRFKHSGRSNAPAPAVSAKSLRPDRASVEAGLAAAWGMAGAKSGAMPADAAHAAAWGMEMPVVAGSIDSGGAQESFGDRVRVLMDMPGATDADVLASVSRLGSRGAAVPGQVRVLAAELSRLEAEAAEGRRRVAEVVSSRHEAIIRAALSEGRITAASASEWRTQLQFDEKAAKALLALQPKNAVPMVEIGYSAESMKAPGYHAKAWGLRD